MDALGPASETLRLAEHYRQMSDGELIELARHPSDLTEMAQAALKQEVASRRLTVPQPQATALPEPLPPPDQPDEESPYAEARQLVAACTVYSLRDALQLQRLLDVAGIPFYMGLERATNVDSVTSSFAAGVEVYVMRAAYPWIWEPLGRYEPKDEPPEEQIDWNDGTAMRCPKCRSTDVIFERLTMEPPNGAAKPPTFNWICGACGHSWQDDGVQKKI